TFGRGFYVLDDYTPLRHLTGTTLAAEGALFPPRRTYRFEQTDAGEGYTTPTPPFGAALTYYLRDGLPQADAHVLLTVSDETGAALRHVKGPAAAGVHRVYWDLQSAGRLVEPGKYRVTL